MVVRGLSRSGARGRTFANVLQTLVTAVAGGMVGATVSALLVGGLACRRRAEELQMVLARDERQPACSARARQGVDARRRSHRH